MNKKEKIKEVWGENYPPSGTDENGWSNDLVNYGTFDVKIYEFIGFLNDAKIRPRILQGIENNNGWIKIESEEDLPKNTINYYVLIDGSLKEALYRGNNRWITIDNPYPKTTEIMKITHYQPIVKPKPPIY